MNRKTLILALLAGIGLGSALVAANAPAQAANAPACEPEKLAEKYPSLVGKTIKIGTDGESPPFSTRDPKDFTHLVGLDNDLIRATFKCAGVPIEFSVGAWSGLMPAVISGQVDVMWDILYYTPERAKKVDFVTYLTAATGALVRKGNPKLIHSINDVCGVRATAGLGTVEEAGFRAINAKCIAAGKPPVDIITYPDNAGGVRLVQNDRADVMMSGLTMINQLIADNPKDFELGYMIITDYKIAAALTKGNKDLAQLIKDGLTVIMADGTYDNLLDKYGIDRKLARTPEILTQ